MYASEDRQISETFRPAMEAAQGLMDGTVLVLDSQSRVLACQPAREQYPLERLARQGGVACPALTPGAELLAGLPTGAAAELEQCLARVQDGDGPVHREIAELSEAVAIEARLVPLDQNPEYTLMLLRECSRPRPSLQDEASDGERLYDHLFHSTLVVKLLIDPDSGRIVDANRAASNFYGWTRDQLREKKISDINTLPTKRVQEEMEAARSEHRQYFRFRHRLADGEERDVEVYSGPVDIGGTTYLHSSIHDVTERVRRERELELIHDIVESLPVGVYRSVMDEEGRMITCNREFIRITEAESIEELRSVPIRELYAEPADRDAYVARVLAASDWHTETLRMRTLRGREGYFRVSVRQKPGADGRNYIDGIAEDVTEQVRVERAREQLLDIINATPAIVGISDPDGYLVYLNRAARDLLGLEPDEPIGHRRAADFHTPESLDVLREEAMPAAVEYGTWTGEMVLRWRDGETMHVQQTLIAHRDEKGEVVRISTVAIDVSAQKQHQRRLEWLANRDSLTGLLNRRGFLRVLRNAVQDAKEKDDSLSVLMLDLDHFKPVNDQHGHPVGDELLRQVATLLRERSRSNDAVGRLGGEEFCILLPGAGEEDAQRIAEEYRRRVADAAFETEVGELRITLSIGVATLKDRRQGGPSLLRRADSALYVAKRGGRNRVEVG